MKWFRFLLLPLCLFAACNEPEIPVDPGDKTDTTAVLPPDTVPVDTVIVVPDTIPADTIVIPQDTLPVDTIDPWEGVTVWGYVTSAGQGIADVVVSDGIEMVTTDSAGRYLLPSAKAHGYVMISIPSGYEVDCRGVLPQFYKYFTQPVDSLEQIDFQLTAADQQSYTMIVMGDMHQAARTKDAAQFQLFATDLNAYRAEHASEKLYGLTLGDMTWDVYWVSNNYNLTNYLADVNNYFTGLPIFHTIGNHDHEMEQAGDVNTVVAYKSVIGPTYYSMNIGGIHYIVLDNIQCTNPGDGTRSYGSFVVSEQQRWLRKDLSYVSTSTPVVIAMHAPMYTDGGSYNLTNGYALNQIMKDYNTTYISGHTHRLYNTIRQGVRELNSGSVCATWWWTGYYTTGLNLAKDGSHGGYRILTVNGSDFEWQYKSTGYPISFQFETFDRNQICLDASVFGSSTKATEDHISAFINDCGAYATPDSSNIVLIDVFDYDPSWTISVTENGVSRSVTRITAKNPLHLLAYEAKRYNAGKTPTSEFKTSASPNMFRVQASSPTSTLEITVTDRFGRTYTETMTRPKTFSLSAYKPH